MGKLMEEELRAGNRVDSWCEAAGLLQVEGPGDSQVGLCLNPSLLGMSLPPRSLARGTACMVLHGGRYAPYQRHDAHR